MVEDVIVDEERVVYCRIVAAGDCMGVVRQGFQEDGGFLNLGPFVCTH